jgi:predicted secreted protein
MCSQHGKVDRQTRSFSLLMFDHFFALWWKTVFLLIHVPIACNQKTTQQNLTVQTEALKKMKTNRNASLLHPTTVVAPAVAFLALDWPLHRHPYQLDYPLFQPLHQRLQEW